MIPLLIVALALLLFLLLPLGVRVRYGENGLLVFLKIAPISIQLFPPKKKKKAKAKKERSKKDKPKQANDHPKQGGPLALVRACLPLVKPALEGIRKRLTIKHLELCVVWAAADPADAALGYGYANAALGMIWPVFYQNFKIKNHSFSCDVDFDSTEPTLYAAAELTMTVFQILTLALPLFVRFIKIYRTVNTAPKGETVKKEA